MEKEYTCETCKKVETTNYTIGKPRRFCKECAYQHKKEYIKEWQKKNRQLVKEIKNDGVVVRDDGTNQ